MINFIVDKRFYKPGWVWKNINKTCLAIKKIGMRTLKNQSWLLKASRANCVKPQFINNL
jgi:hypothetical protein